MIKRNDIVTVCRLALFFAVSAGSGYLSYKLRSNEKLSGAIYYYGELTGYLLLFWAMYLPAQRMVKAKIVLQDLSIGVILKLIDRTGFYIYGFEVLDPTNFHWSEAIMWGAIILLTIIRIKYFTA